MGSLGSKKIYVGQIINARMVVAQNSRLGGNAAIFVPGHQKIITVAHPAAQYQND